MGHEYVGVVEEIGDSVKTVKVGDFLVGSFVISDNTCEICHASYQSRCVHGEFVAQTIGTQAERARNTCPRWSLTRSTAPGASTSNLGTARLVGSGLPLIPTRHRRNDRPWAVTAAAVPRRATIQAVTAEAVGVVPLGLCSSANRCDCVQFWA
jgi:Alcohol dehydrogenase GroES-like domain